MDEYITRQEHEEFCKRLEDEDRRQNKRLDVIEETQKEIHTMSNVLTKMCEKMNSMSSNVANLTEKVEIIEGRDGEMWRTVVSYVVVAVIGVVIGYIF